MKFKTARPKKAGKRGEYQFPSHCCVLVSDGKANCAPDNLAAVLGFVLREFSACKVLHTGAIQAGNIAIKDGIALAEAQKKASRIEADLMANMQTRIAKSPAARACDFAFTSYSDDERARVREGWQPVVQERLVNEQAFRDDLTESVIQFWKRRTGKETALEPSEEETLRKAVECIMLNQQEALTALGLPRETANYLKNSCQFLIDECADIGYWKGLVLYPGDLSPVLINMMEFINQRESRPEETKLVFVGVKVKETNIKEPSVWDDIRHVTHPDLSASHSTQKAISEQFLDTCALQDPALLSPTPEPLSLVTPYQRHGFFNGDVRQSVPDLSHEELEAIRDLFTICRYVSQESPRTSMAFLVQHHAQFSDIAKQLPTGYSCLLYTSDAADE